jgi:CcmD family protein
MDAWVWILIAVVAIVVIAILAYVVAIQRRRKQLQREFGPEYERAVERSGDVRSGESDLLSRRDRRRALEIRPLRPESRENYRHSWEQIQARFVDDPAGVLGQADGLIIAVMGERGYPMDDFEQRADDISVDHPDVVQHYRAGHAISERVGRGRDVSTEDLRKAFVHYRALFGVMVEPDTMEPGVEKTDQERRATG